MRRERLIIIFLLCLLSHCLYARQKYIKHKNKDTRCPKLYLGASGGLENPQGTISAGFDFPFLKSVSLCAGGGWSTWGNKFSGEVRLYKDRCKGGYALGIGASHNTGLSTKDIVLMTDKGLYTVPVELKPVSNVFISIYKFWRVGYGGNRVHLQFGYSARLTDDYYSISSNYAITLTKKAREDMHVYAPGGIILAADFSFGLH